VKNLRCSDFGGRRKSGAACGRAPGWGTDKDTGPCKDHVAIVAAAAETGIKVRNQTAFLAAMRRTGNISAAARAANVDRSMHYTWLEQDFNYRKSFEDAKAESIEVLEAEARRRAIAGIKRLKFTRNGKPIIDPKTGEPYVEHAYSDTLLIFLLKAEAPEKYRERLDVSGPGGGPIATVAEHSLSGKSLAELAAMRATLLAQSAGTE